MLALGCDHGGYELKLEMRRESSIKIMAVTAWLP